MMKNNIAFEDMPQSAKQAYSKMNRSRILTMFLSPVIGLLMCIMLVSMSSGTGSEMFTLGLMMFIIFSGALQGIMHMVWSYKKLLRGFKKIPIIIFAVPYLMIYLIPLSVLFAVSTYAGVVFLIIDIVRFVKKKPLIYKYEHKNFLELPEVQAELALGNIQAASTELK